MQFQTAYEQLLANSDINQKLKANQCSKRHKLSLGVWQQTPVSFSVIFKISCASQHNSTLSTVHTVQRVESAYEHSRAVVDRCLFNLWQLASAHHTGHHVQEI